MIQKFVLAYKKNPAARTRPAVNKPDAGFIMPAPFWEPVEVGITELTGEVSEVVGAKDEGGKLVFLAEVEMTVEEVLWKV